MVDLVGGLLYECPKRGAGFFVHANVAGFCVGSELGVVGEGAQFGGDGVGVGGDGGESDLLEDLGEAGNPAVRGHVSG